MIRKTYFKETEAIEISNEKAHVIVLPRIGGKIASYYLIEKNFELLDQTSDNVYREASTGDCFSDYDTSGFDDCFPNIDYSLEYIGNKAIEYPDHGELWSARFQTHIPDDGNYVVLTYESASLAYSFKKTISLENSTLKLKYEITNKGRTTLEGFYTLHCLAKCESNMHIDLGDDVDEIINVTNSKYLGEIGTKHPYPFTRDIMNRPYRLDRIHKRSAGKYEKYYASKPKTIGSCSLHYPNTQVSFSISYDPEKLPYLGFWVTEGGYKNAYNCALEPSSGFYDSMVTARDHNKFNRIKPNETFTFDLEMLLY